MRIAFSLRRRGPGPFVHLAASAALSLAIAALFFLAGLGSLGRGGDERVAEAFASGALSDDLKGDHVTGRHQYNDCLILALALYQERPVRQLAVSPVNPFGRSERVCQDLRTGTHAADKPFYHNYLHGHTVLLRYLLPLLPVQAVRELYKGLASLLLLAGIAICLLRLRRRESVEDQLILLVTLLGLSRFFGLEWFGQSLGHGPADLVLIGFVLSAVLASGRLGTGGWALVAAAFGALTIIFEFLTGGLPLGAAAVIGLGWFFLSPAVRSVGAVLLGLAAYITAAATVVAVKIAMVASTFGAEAVLAIAAAGGERMHGSLPPQFADRGAAEQLLLSVGVLSPGLPLLASGLLLLSISLGAASVLRRPEQPALLLLASCLPILGWFLLFQQHTAIHAWFMARILVWPLIAGLAAVAWSLVRDSRAPIPETSARLPATSGPLS